MEVLEDNFIIEYYQDFWNGNITGKEVPRDLEGKKKLMRWFLGLEIPNNDTNSSDYINSAKIRSTQKPEYGLILQIFRETYGFNKEANFDPKIDLDDEFRLLGLQCVEKGYVRRKMPKYIIYVLKETDEVWGVKERW